MLEIANFGSSQEEKGKNEKKMKKKEKKGRNLEKPE